MIICPQNERKINTYRVNTIHIGRGDPIQLLRKRVNKGKTIAKIVEDGEDPFRILEG